MRGAKPQRQASRSFRNPTRAFTQGKRHGNTIHPSQRLTRAVLGDEYGNVVMVGETTTPIREE